MVAAVLRVRIACLFACLALPAQAWAIANQPLHWSRAAVADDDQAVEHLTLRALSSGGQETFIRIQMANAGMKHGELEVTFRQEAKDGTYYAQDKFERGKYTVFSDHFGIKAGNHVLEVKNNQLVGQLQFASGLTVSFALQPQVGTITAVDRGGDGYIWRELLVPMGKLPVNAAEMTGRTLIDHHATGFALHDISVATAHRTYDRSVRLRSLHPGSYMLIDYSVLPDDRGHKPLGFIVISSKGKTVAAEVVKETRENEQIDGKINYQVPWQITVLGKRGDARTAIRLTAEKQTEREDDLAGLGWMARKAVGMLFHPITYTLKGTANAELQVTPAEEAITLDASVKYQYSQVR